MRIEATVATLNSFSHNGTESKFTEDQLIKLAETAKDIPITIDFDADSIIGKIDSANVVDGNLVITGKIHNDAKYEDSYLVPGYELPDYKSISYGVTKRPCDISVGFIKYP